jgi:hypothetical protein
MKKHGHHVLTALRAACLVLFASSQGVGQAAQQAEAPPREIKVAAKKNPGDVRYDQFYDLQQRLIGYLPPEPRLFDAVQRVSFTRVSLAEQDAYEPPGWAVSIVGDGVDETLPIRRGGYFVLPYLEDAYKGRATVMFKDQSKRNYTDTAWVMRVGESRQLRYADFGKALEQLREVQDTIPLIRAINYRVEKYSNYDGLKACFLDNDGAMLIDGKPAAHAVVGNCWVLKYDRKQANGGPPIEFRGRLDIVTLIETEPYLRAKS